MEVDTYLLMVGEDLIVLNSSRFMVLLVVVVSCRVAERQDAAERVVGAGK